MRALILLMFLSGTALAGVNPIIVPGPGYVDGSGVVDGNLLMGDDLQLQFGAAPDYWWEYVSGSTLYRLRTSDSDGAGADGTVFSVADGALGVVFGGALAVGGPISESAATVLDLGTDGVPIFTNTAGTGFTALALGPRGAAVAELTNQNNSMEVRRNSGANLGGVWGDNIRVGAAVGLGTATNGRGIWFNDGDLLVQSGAQFQFGSAANMSAGADTGLERVSAGTVGATDGSTGLGSLNANALFAPTAASDVAAQSLYAKAGDSWAQATGGSQTGANLTLAGGIGSNVIVCADRTLGDQDVITLTVDGADTTLTESTDFDCEGEASEEVCCDNLGTAITSAAIGITPDCDTTAGSCYLTFDAGLFTFDMAIADGAANGVFATLTEGADGDVSVPAQMLLSDGAVGAPALSFASDPDTGIYYTSTVGGQIHLAASGANVMKFYNTGGVTYAGAGSSSVQFGTSGANLLQLTGTKVQILGAGGLQFGTASTIVTSATDGKPIITNAAATSGVMLDVTTDNTLQFRSRAGADTSTINGSVFNARATGNGFKTAGAIRVGSDDQYWFASGADGTSQAEQIGLYRVSATAIGIQDVGSVENAITWDIGASAKGAKTNQAQLTETITFAGGGGGATAVGAADFLPDGCRLDGISGYVTVANNGGACTDIDIGTAADDDLFAENLAHSQTTTFDNSNTSAPWTAHNPTLADTQIVITGVGGNCIDAAVRITRTCTTTTADTVP